jgi:hypothetical protein
MLMLWIAVWCPGGVAAGARLDRVATVASTPRQPAAVAKMTQNLIPLVLALKPVAFGLPCVQSEPGADEPEQPLERADDDAVTAVR